MAPTNDQFYLPFGKELAANGTNDPSMLDLIRMLCVCFANLTIVPFRKEEQRQGCQVLKTIPLCGRRRLIRSRSLQVVERSVLLLLDV